jgi:tRNA uridine 5-carboxymethylaminomethyl modification enzyme
LIAGINAALFTKEQEPFVLSRDQAYIGVLIDDLITKGTEEPYRMFTSRAEYRTLLRQDNADERLTPLAHKIGLVSDERLFHVEQKLAGKQNLIKKLENTSGSPDELNNYLLNLNTAPLTQKVRLSNVLARPEVRLSEIAALFPFIHENLVEYGESASEILEQVEIEAKYSGYLNKEREMAEKMLRLEHIRFPEKFDYSLITNLSTESRQKLQKIRPETLGQASRISGVSPADISVLMVHIGR